VNTICLQAAADGLGFSQVTWPFAIIEIIRNRDTVKYLLVVIEGILPGCQNMLFPVLVINYDIANINRSE
jgi:hypothetical protein